MGKIKPYVKTDWVPGLTPVTRENMTNIEEQVESITNVLVEASSTDKSAGAIVVRNSEGKVEGDIAGNSGTTTKFDKKKLLKVTGVVNGQVQFDGSEEGDKIEIATTLDKGYQQLLDQKLECFLNTKHMQGCPTLGLGQYCYVINDIVVDGSRLYEVIDYAGEVKLDNGLWARLVPRKTITGDLNDLMFALTEKILEGLNQLEGVVLAIRTEKNSALTAINSDKLTALSDIALARGTALGTLEQYMHAAENGGNANSVQGYVPRNFKRTEDTIADLVSSASSKYRIGDIVELNGYHTAGDGAGHKRKIESADDGSGVQLANGLWANIVHNGEVNVSWFGGNTDSSLSYYNWKSVKIDKDITLENPINLKYGCRLYSENNSSIIVMENLGSIIISNGFNNCSGVQIRILHPNWDGDVIRIVSKINGLPGRIFNSNFDNILISKESKNISGNAIHMFNEEFDLGTPKNLQGLFGVYFSNFLVEGAFKYGVYIEQVISNKDSCPWFNDIKFYNFEFRGWVVEKTINIKKTLKDNGMAKPDKYWPNEGIYFENFSGQCHYYNFEDLDQRFCDIENSRRVSFTNCLAWDYDVPFYKKNRCPYRINIDSKVSFAGVPESFWYYCDLIEFVGLSGESRVQEEQKRNCVIKYEIVDKKDNYKEIIGESDRINLFSNSWKYRRLFTSHPWSKSLSYTETRSVTFDISGEEEGVAQINKETIAFNFKKPNSQSKTEATMVSSKSLQSDNMSFFFVDNTDGCTELWVKFKYYNRNCFIKQFTKHDEDFFNGFELGATPFLEKPMLKERMYKNLGEILDIEPSNANYSIKNMTPIDVFSNSYVSRYSTKKIVPIESGNSGILTIDIPFDVDMGKTFFNCTLEGEPKNALFSKSLSSVANTLIINYASSEGIGGVGVFVEVICVKK